MTELNELEKSFYKIIEEYKVQKTNTMDFLQFIKDNIVGPGAYGAHNSSKKILDECSKLEKSIITKENNILNETISIKDCLIKLKNTLQDFNILEKEYKDLKQEIKLLEKDHYYNYLKEEKERLITEVKAKDLILIELKIEIMQLKEEKEKLDNIDISDFSLDSIKELDDLDIKQQLIKLKKKIVSQKKEFDKINEELKRIKIENEQKSKILLRYNIDFLAGEELEIPPNEVIEKYENEIEKLNQEIQNLKDIEDLYRQKNDIIMKYIKYEELKQENKDLNNKIDSMRNSQINNICINTNICYESNKKA